MLLDARLRGLYWFIFKVWEPKCIKVWDKKIFNFAFKFKNYKLILASLTWIYTPKLKRCSSQTLPHTSCSTYKKLWSTIRTYPINPNNPNRTKIHLKFLNTTCKSKTLHKQQFFYKTKNKRWKINLLYSRFWSHMMCSQRSEHILSILTKQTS